MPSWMRGEETKLLPSLFRYCSCLSDDSFMTALRLLRCSYWCVQVQSGNEEVVKELLKLGANVDLQDDVRI